MRVFIAINLENSVKKYIKNIQEYLKENSKKGSFSNEDNFHITLKFIGEIEQSDIEDLCCAIDETCYSFRNFKISLNTLGFFSNYNKSTAWVGVNESKELKLIYSKLEKNTQKYGFSNSRQKFTPHITIARQIELKKSREEIKNDILAKCEIHVKSIELMESKREGSRLIYLPIYTSKLK